MYIKDFISLEKKQTKKKTPKYLKQIDIKDRQVKLYEKSFSE